MARRFPLFVLALLLAFAAAAPGPEIVIAMTDCSIQSGLPPTLNACSDPDGPTCIGGLASVSALLRRRHGTDNPNMYFIPTVDMFSAFVQVHPKGLGVNAVVFKKFGIKHYVPWHPSLAPKEVEDQKFPDLASDTPAFLMTNAFFSPAWYLYGYPIQWIYNPNVVIGSLIWPNVGGAADGAKTYKEAKGRRKDNLPTIIIARFLELYQLAQLSTLPDPPELVVVEGITGGTPPSANQTTGIQMMGSTTVVFCPVDNRYVIGSLHATFDGKKVVSAWCVIDSVVVGPENRDALYYEHQRFLTEQGRVAEEFDQVIGRFTDVLPHSIEYQADDEFNNLACAAMLWESGADMAFMNGGAIMGPGLPAGPVKKGDIFAHFPWPDAMCRGDFLGGHIFDIVNLFVEYETNNQTLYYNFSYGGLRLRYDINREPRHRLISVDVQNRTTGHYHPLDRLKMYKFITLDYVCIGMHDKATELFKAKFRGESVIPQDSAAAQVIIQDYINATSPVLATNYSAKQRIVIVDDNLPSMVLSWNHTRDTCTGTWHEDVGSCISDPVSSSSSMTWLIILVVVVVAVLFAVIVVPVARVLAANKARDVRNAPQSNPVSIVFTDVEKSTHLWTIAPHSMQTALDMHFKIIRKLIQKHKAYEVKTIGDAFMIAVSTPDIAVALAHDIQLESQRTRWPRSIMAAYDQIEREEQGQEDDGMGPILTDAPDDLASNSSTGSNNIAVVPFNGEKRNKVVKGLRIRCGVHVGDCEIKLDSVAKGYDYFGPTVNCASRVESRAEGGQTLITGQVRQGLSSVGDMSIKKLGTVKLRGMSRPVEVIEAFPKVLAKRSEVFHGTWEETEDPLTQGASMHTNDSGTFKIGIDSPRPNGSTGSTATLPDTSTPFGMLLHQSVPEHEARIVEKEVRGLARNVVKLMKPLREHEQDDFVRRLFTAWRLPPLQEENLEMAIDILCLRSHGTQRPISARNRAE